MGSKESALGKASKIPQKEVTMPSTKSSSLMINSDDDLRDIVVSGTNIPVEGVVVSLDYLKSISLDRGILSNSPTDKVDALCWARLKSKGYTLGHIDHDMLDSVDKESYSVASLLGKFVEVLNDKVFTTSN